MTRLLKYIFFFTVVFMMFACADDYSFSSNKALRLSFSEDTVSFDTVVNTVSSSTKRVMIFNGNSDGIRIQSARLASGGTSGFHINIDGQKGPEVNNLEVLKNDSIFMLVQFITDTKNSDEPVLMRDSVLFLLESGVEQKLILEAYGQDCIIMYSPVCKRGETMTFKSGIPYIIYDSLVVDSDATVNIEAGATLMFHSGAGILVYGKLNINGAEGNMATLRGDRTDRLFSYLPYDRVDSQWGGIRFYESSIDNVIRYADIHGGSYGIICDSTGIENTKLTIENSIVINFNEYALRSVSNKINVYNSIISNARYDCVNLTGGEYDFAHCTIAQFYGFHARKGNALRVSNLNGETPCDISVNLCNSIITGFSEDEIFASRFAGNDQVNKESVLFDLSFRNCLVTTDTIGAGQYFQNCIIDDINEDINRKKHFKCVDTHAFIFDYHLDSLSVGCNKATSEYLISLPKDMYGKERVSQNIDLGALQR